MDVAGCPEKTFAQRVSSGGSPFAAWTLECRVGVLRVILEIDRHRLTTLEGKRKALCSKRHHCSALEAQS